MEKGYGITTWRMTLRCGHPEWLVETEKLYRQVCLFYYNLILEEGIVDGKGGIQQMQREAERLTIRGGTKRNLSGHCLLRRYLLIFGALPLIKPSRRPEARRPASMPEDRKHWRHR